MASIVSTGIGSGLDIAGLVQQLVAAEGQPAEARISQREARVQARLSAFGSLKSALADLRDRLDAMKSQSSFLARTATSDNEDYFTASASTGALPASYDVEVVQIALAQKLTSGAFADQDTVVGTGTLTLSTGSGTTNIEITAENNTLAGIRDAINSAADNPGVAATIVNADSGSYLILSSLDTGAANGVTVTQNGGDGGLAALEYDPPMGLNSLTETVAAQDALIRIDGLDVMSDSNTFADAINGVTIGVVAASSGAIEKLRVENDEETVRQLVADFVASYNGLVDTFDNIASYDSESELAAPLLGDASVRSIRDQLRREIGEAVTDLGLPFSMLRDVGIEAQLDGRLTINDSELSTVLSGNFEEFGKLFSSENGFAMRLFDLTDGYLKLDGIIETRSQGLTTSIEAFADERQALNARLASLEGRLLRQFNALDSLLAQLSSTGDFLTQQLDNLPGVTAPGNT